jgi:hypothetical protein
VEAEPVVPTLTVRAISAGPERGLVAQTGPVDSFDLGRSVQDVIKQVRSSPEAIRKKGFSIECTAELIDVPDLHLEAPLVEELATLRASLAVELLNKVESRAASATDESNSVLPEVTVEFFVRGRGFDPAELTDRIGRTPTRVSRADERPETSNRRLRRLDTWTVSLGPRRASDFASELEMLLSELGPKAGEIKSFCIEYRAEAVFAFVTEFVNRPPRLTLTALELDAIASFGAGLWYDLYRRGAI